ncbi:hypothetical protein D3C86_1103910 [compost metagenome]
MLVVRHVVEVRDPGEVEAIALAVPVGRKAPKRHGRVRSPARVLAIGVGLVVDVGGQDVGGVAQQALHEGEGGRALAEAAAFLHGQEVARDLLGAQVVGVELLGDARGDAPAVLLDALDQELLVERGAARDEQAEQQGRDQADLGGDLGVEVLEREGFLHRGLPGRRGSAQGALAIARRHARGLEVDLLDLALETAKPREHEPDVAREALVIRFEEELCRLADLAAVHRQVARVLAGEFLEEDLLRTVGGW